MSEFSNVGPLTNFPDNIGVSVTVGAQAVCVVRSGNEIFAFDDRCTHAEAMLSRGDVEDGEIVCPLHGARFSIRTGEALTLPAVKPVRMHEAKIDGDQVFVKLRP